MNALAVVSTILGILGAVCAIVFGLTTYKRNQKKNLTILRHLSGGVGNSNRMSDA